MDVQLDALDKFRVRLTFLNKAETTQQLALDRIGQPKLNGNYFNFDPLPAPVYLGIMMKRRPYTADELIKVEPGESFVAEVDLDSYYDLSDRSLDVPLRVSYRAAHPLYVETVRILQSNWTVFPVTGLEASS